MQTDMLQITKRLFSDWESRGVRYCHWKSNEHLAEGLRGETDLDILCDETQKDAAEEGLRSCGYLRMRSQYGSRYPGVEDWIGFGPEKGRLVHIHLHYQLVTGHAGMKEYDLPWTAKVLDTSVADPETGVRTTEPNLEMIFLLTRIGLKCTLPVRRRVMNGTYRLGKGDEREIAWLLERTDPEKIRKLAEPVYGSQAGRLAELALSERHDAAWMKELNGITVKALKPFCRTGRISGALLRSWYWNILLLRYELKKRLGMRLVTRKTLEDGGISVALIGQDGAGKSTVIGEVNRWLSWKMDVQQYYMGCGDGYRSAAKHLADICGRHGPLKSLSPLFTVVSHLQVSRKIGRNVRSARKHMEKGCIVLFDRFPQTMYAGINDGPKIRTLAEKRGMKGMLGAVLNRAASLEERRYAETVRFSPTLVLKLTLDPEESIRRKPQEPLENVRKKHEIIASLPFPGSEVVTVDAAEEIREEIRQIHCAIWDCIQKTRRPGSVRSGSSDRKEKLILELIRYALWGGETPPAADEAAYEELKAHTIHTLPGPALSRIRMDEKLRAEWKKALIEQLLHREWYLNAQKKLGELCFPYVILKGTVAAQYYPYPEYRILGDIDLMVREEDFVQVCNWMISHGYPETADEDGGIRHRSFSVQDVVVEIHRYFSKLNDPEKAEALDAIILEGFNDSHILGDDANGLVLLEHISQHLESGLGLRQIIDWMMFVDRYLTDERWPDFRIMTEKTGLTELAVVVTRMCERELGLPERKWCADADPELCDGMMSYILSCGNFGRKFVEDSDNAAYIMTRNASLKSMMKTLQYSGLKNWKAVRKHRLFHPFAWIYQAFRYLHRGIRTDWVGAIRESRKRRKMFIRLGVRQDSKGVSVKRNGRFVKP